MLAPRRAFHVAPLLIIPETLLTCYISYLMSAKGGRPSGPWGRLKPVNLDPLESVGLPSKGDNRYIEPMLAFT